MSKKLLIPMVIILFVIIAAGGVYLVNSNKEKVSESIKESSKENTNIEMNDLYEYLSKNKLELDADFKYISDSNSIEAVVRNSKGEYISDVTIGKFEDSNTLYIEDSKEDKYIVYQDLNIYNVTSEDKGFRYIYLGLSLNIKSYFSNVLHGGQQG